MVEQHCSIAVCFGAEWNGMEWDGMGWNGMDKTAHCLWFAVSSPWKARSSPLHLALDDSDHLCRRRLFLSPARHGAFNRLAD